MRWFSISLRFRMVAMVFLILSSVLPIIGFGQARVRADSGPQIVQASAVTSPSGYEGVDGVGQSGQGLLVTEPDVAAGPDHVIEVVQGEGRIYLKGSLCNPSVQSTLCSWSPSPVYMVKLFNNGNSCDDIGDTRIVYDPWSGRWFAAGVHWIKDCSTGATQQILADIAVSYSSDPTTPWNILFPHDWKDYHAPTGSSYDFPEIAVTDDKLVLTTQLNATLLVYRKADLVSFASSPLVQNLTSQIPSQCYHTSERQMGKPYLVRNYGSTARQYMICSGDPLSDHTIPFYLFYVEGAVPNATCCGTVTQITAISPPKSRVPPYADASWPYAAAPILNGSAVNYITFANSISAAWSNNLLWFATTSACPDLQTQDCIRLAQFNTSSPPPNYCNVNSVAGLCQNFYLNLQGCDVFLPALSIDNAQGLNLVFGYSSSSVNPSLGVIGQAWGDPSGYLTSWKTLKAGVTYQTDMRFSDYFGAALDPIDTTLVWVTGGYILSGPCKQGGSTLTCWASWIGSMRVVGLKMVATPGSLTVYPGAVGSTNVTLQPLSGFTGRVNLTAGASPQLQGGPTASVSRSSVRISLGRSNFTMAAGDASSLITPGSYALYVTGQTLYFSLTLSIPLTVPYFDFTGVDPSTLAYIQGVSSSVPSTITLASRLGFTGTVSLSTYVPPGSGITIYLGAPAVTPPPGGSVSFGVNVWTSASTPGGTYQVRVTGTYGSYSQFVYLTVKVGSYYCTASASPTSGRLSVTVSFSVTCLAGVQSVRWYFNDGTGATSTAQNTTRTYYWEVGGGSTQRFYPTVTVTDGNGNTYYPGVPVITLTCTSGCPQLPSP